MRVLSCCVRALGGWFCLPGGVGGVLWWVIGLLSLCVGLRVRARLCVRVRVGFVSCLWGVGVSGVCGERGCLGAGCVVAGGGLPVWLGDAVASGGVSVGFDVGLRVFVLSGAGVRVSGGVAASGSSVSAPVSGLVGSGSGVLVGGSMSGSVVEGSVSSSDVSAHGSGPVDVADGVAVCVPCARAVFGDGWCSLVLRRWCAAAGVDAGVVDGLLGSGDSVSVGVGGGSAASLRSSVLVVASSPGSAAGSVSSASLRSPVGGGRVGVGFGARVRDWGACVGVGGGVVSGGGVVAGWWAEVVGRVRALASGVGVKGLVLAGLVGVVLLVSAKVLVG